MEKVYACIDLKSFYASCECVERHLNSITTNLVVADKERTEKTICLAVSPSLKSYGIPGRARLFEVIKKVDEINNTRLKKINKFQGSSYNNDEIKLNPYLKLDYIIAKPRMALYMEYSAKIYSIYLKYVSKDDIYSYSIDEVFMDITNYLKYNKMTKEEMITKIILDIYDETGITATGGMGTNLYLAKVAMDIMSKHIKPNQDNVRIAYLDEKTYREKLWNHVPITDFWRVGKGYFATLYKNKLYTMGDIARCSIDNEELLYQLFGVNAEILIDHAWGYEPCTIKDIKNYKSENNSISIGQVLKRPYDYLETKIIVLEMIDSLILSLIDKNLYTNKIGLTINYDSENLNNNYIGAIKKDYYGRMIPKEAHGVIDIDHYTCSSKLIIDKIEKLYKNIAKNNLSSRRITVCFLNVLKEEDVKKREIRQLDLFSDVKNDSIEEENDKKVSKTVLAIKKKYGKNSLIKGINLLESATGRERNEEIGGHHE